MNDKDKSEIRARLLAQLPTATELARIAAALAKHGVPIDGPELARDALGIWSACQKEIEACVRHSIEEHFRPSEPDQPAMIRPKEFPMTLKQFLKLAFPKVKTDGEREIKFREFLKDTIPVNRAIGRANANGLPLPDEATLKDEPPASKEEIGERLAGYKAKITSDQFDGLYQSVANWREDRRRRSKSENAKTRWNRPEKGR